MDETRPPTYVEAYPRLDPAELQRACNEGKRLCQFIDEKDYRVGAAFIIERTPDGFRIGHWASRSYLGSLSGVAALTLTTVAHIENRPVVFCPDCGERRGVLVLVGTWACKQCQGLLYRTQVVDLKTRRWERRRFLEETLGHGRPKGMRNRRYAELRDELEQIKNEQQNEPLRYAARDHQYLIRREWVKADERGLAQHCRTVVHEANSQLPSAASERVHEPMRMNFRFDELSD